MTIGAVTLVASGVDVATTGSTPFNIITPSFTTVAGRLYLLFVSESASSNGVTAGGNHAGTSWSYQKTQTNGAGIITELFGGLCTTGATGTATLNWPASAVCTYAIVEVENPAATTPIVQKPSAAALTVTMAAATGVQPAIFFGARNGGTALTPEAGYTTVTAIGSTHKLLVGYRSTFETTPSFTATSSSAPAIIGAEIASVASAAGVRTMTLLGVGYI